MKRYMRVFIPMAFLLFGCVFVANANAAEIVDESTSGGGISVPETPLSQIAPEEAAPSIGTELEESPIPAGFSAQDDIIDVALPNDIPFDILIFSNIGEGVVLSNEFRVANNNDYPVNIAICDARVNIANEDSFSVRSDENLPEEGNNIYIDMICDAGGESAHTVLGTEADGENFVFALDGGASGTFRFDGVVNEYGDIKWEETSIMIFLRFEIEVPMSDIISTLVPLSYPIDEDMTATEGNTEEVTEDAPPEPEAAAVSSPADDDAPVLESSEKNEQSETVNAEDITPAPEQSQDAQPDAGAEKL